MFLTFVMSILATLHAVLLLVIAPLRGWKPRGQPSSATLSAAVIVPCCGDLDGALEGNLRAIAGQRQPPARLILVARSHLDPAMPTMRRLESEMPFVRVVVAGVAKLCGQKNHNLLKAVRRAGEANVYVFADADIRPDANWLASLLEPLENDPRIGATTALCDLPPARDGFVAATQALFTLHQSSFQRLLSMPWGGSMAVRACLFRSAGVASAWGRTVLDDWVLWRCIAPRARIATVPSIRSGATSSAHCWRDCLEWNVRQYQYFKLYRALAFRTLVVTQLLAWGVCLGLPVRAFLRGSPIAETFWPSICYLALSALLNVALFQRTRGRVPMAQRLAASLITPPLIGYVTVAAWLRRALVWRGITYRMDRQGQVVSMKMDAPELQGESRQPVPPAVAFQAGRGEIEETVPEGAMPMAKPG